MTAADKNHFFVKNKIFDDFNASISPVAILSERKREYRLH